VQLGGKDMLRDQLYRILEPDTAALLLQLQAADSDFAASKSEQSAPLSPAAAQRHTEALAAMNRITKAQAEEEVRQSGRAVDGEGRVQTEAGAIVTAKTFREYGSAERRCSAQGLVGEDGRRFVGFAAVTALRHEKLRTEADEKGVEYPQDGDRAYVNRMAAAALRVHTATEELEMWALAMARQLKDEGETTTLVERLQEEAARRGKSMERLLRRRLRLESELAIMPRGQCLELAQGLIEQEQFGLPAVLCSADTVTYFSLSSLHTKTDKTDAIENIDLRFPGQAKATIRAALRLVNQQTMGRQRAGEVFAEYMQTSCGQYMVSAQGPCSICCVLSVAACCYLPASIYCYILRLIPYFRGRLVCCSWSTTRPSTATLTAPTWSGHF
jgi:hypothetical protein